MNTQRAPLHTRTREGIGRLLRKSRTGVTGGCTARSAFMLLQIARVIPICTFGAILEEGTNARCVADRPKVPLAEGLGELLY